MTAIVPPTVDVDPHRIAESVTSLYREADVPPPSVSFPITPLGPLLDMLPVVCREIPDLTSREAEIYLHKRGSLSEPFELGVATTEALAGFLYAGADQSFVFLSANDPIFRRRFSLAHEVGHLVLHLPGWLSGQMDKDAGFLDFFTTEQAEGRATEKKGDPHLFREREADAFAAELLLPEAVVRPLARDARREGFTGIGLAERIAITMLVSRAAMWRRLVVLGMVTSPDNGDLSAESLAEPME